ncbi:hypothetical protein DL766_004925 [Monosporascus sp. MC13-8B]|uniref:aldehyde dehydrogenase (NAD(+)) n=1 Tax=Monosporascus cannonballus TaxID=155416 RepID=A0ABY0HKT4_9PEZI|nr:hypothetical protein DL763_010207 [Monosporascus cannonballus]RYO92795.1 hypothetical protein DL762_001501 [Monosporascus cannonballus]RYP30324.1 hypothetical protein DL766_004925 [Monosporascus sp. MC13-8B]
MSSLIPGGGSELQFLNIIDGKPRAAKEHHQVIDPRTEEPLWDAPVASPQDLDDAVEAARRAFKTWKKSTVTERQAKISEVARCVDKNKELLSAILMKETGKPKLMADVEIERTVMHFEYYTGVALEDELQYEDEKTTVIATHVPIGVLGAISPWNFPVILSSVKVASALATGNCVIIKPSPFTPYSLLKFCELAQSVLPPGVFQALNGGADLGERMTLHPGIDHISFTGTIAVGRRIMENCAKTFKKVILELAGNDAAIVCEDVDLPKTVPMVAAGALMHAGQLCVASKRIYVHEAIYDRFLDLLVEEVKKYAGNPDPTVPNAAGPISNKANYERVLSIIDDCKKNKHKIVTGGEVQSDRKGFWVAPTIVSKPPEDSFLVKEEQFGPIIPLLSWTDEDDVIARANSLDNSGLGASVWTPDGARALRIARQLEAGSVWINQPELPHQGSYFSGWKLSGFNGELGKRGLLNYSNTQSLLIAK